MKRRSHILIVAALAVASGLAGGWIIRFPEASFDEHCPQFLEKNEALTQNLERMPPSRYRDLALAAALENRRWAEEYRRTGIDPEVLVELKSPGPEVASKAK